MTDDNMMGGVLCCIPLRYYAGFVALALFLYGALNIAYLFLVQLLNLGSTPPQQPCVGDKCLEILSCDGLQEASMHVRMCVLIFGGLIFGGYGVVGSINHHPSELRWLASFLCGLGIVFGAVWLFDLAYSGTCGRYTQNVIDLAVLWPLRNYPAHEGLKFELQVAATYPTRWADGTVGFSIFRLYSWVTFCWTVLFIYSAHWVQVLARYSNHGVFGLGANHDVGTWREQLLLQREVAAQFTEAGQMAKLTMQDVGWRAHDDYVSYGAAQRDVEHNLGEKVNYRDEY